MTSTHQRCARLRPRPGGRPAWVALVALLLLGCAQDNPPSGDSPDADEAWLRLENESSETVVELYLVKTEFSAGGWGPDQLEEAELKPGETFRLRDVPCPEFFDLRAVAESGAEHIERELDFGCSEIVQVSLTGFP